MMEVNQGVSEEVKEEDVEEGDQEEDMVVNMDQMVKVEINEDIVLNENVLDGPSNGAPERWMKRYKIEPKKTVKINLDKLAKREEINRPKDTTGLYGKKEFAEWEEIVLNENKAQSVDEEMNKVEQKTGEVNRVAIRQEINRLVDEVNNETIYRNHCNRAAELQSYLKNKTVFVSKNPQTTLLKTPDTRSITVISNKNLMNETSYKEYSVFPRKRRVSNEEVKKVVVVQEQKKVVIPITRTRTESMSEHVKGSKWLRQRQISNVRINNALVDDGSLPNNTKKIRLTNQATPEDGYEALSDDLADEESLGGWEVGQDYSAPSKKVLNERQRRKGLSRLFDNLEDMVNSRVDETGQLVVPQSSRKSSYVERTTAARDCIVLLEAQIQEQEAEFSQELDRQDRLKEKLASLGQEQGMELSQEAEARGLEMEKRKLSLYSCSRCPGMQRGMGRGVRGAFLHQETYHSGTSSPIVQRLKGPTPRRPDLDLGPAPARGRPKQVTVVKCQECPTVCLDMDVLRVHKFLHQDLTYLRCPHCSLVYGVPSQLKRHVFLQHGTILETGELATSVVDMKDRVWLTSKVQQALTIGDPEQIPLVENFISATLDARLVLAELSLQAEVDSMPVGVLSEVVSQYLGGTKTTTLVKEDALSFVDIKGTGLIQIQTGASSSVRKGQGNVVVKKEVNVRKEEQDHNLNKEQVQLVQKEKVEEVEKVLKIKQELVIKQEPQQEEVQFEQESIIVPFVDIQEEMYIKMEPTQ